MRLFNRQGTQETEQERPSKPPEDTNPEEDDLAASNGVPPEVDEEEIPSLPADADLDTLYDTNGNSRFVDDQGRAVDEDGNLIPETRPDLEEGEPPAEEPPVETRAEFQLPDGELDEADRKLLAERVDPDVLRVFDKLITTRANRIALGTIRQQQAVTQSLGVEPAVLSELEQDIRQAEALISFEVRASEDGPSATLLTALGLRAKRTGKPIGEILREFGNREPQAPVRKPVQRLAPSETQPIPRGNTGTAPARVRGGRDAATQSFAKDGSDGDAALAIIRAERKPANAAR